MGLFDRFLPNRPRADTPRGRSGRLHTNGFLQLEELNADLQGRKGLETFDRMWRSDGDCRRSLAMVCNPIIAGTWSIEPNGGDEAEQQDLDIAEFVQWALFEQMRPNLKLHLAEAVPLTARSGFAPFEQIWKDATYQGRQVLVPRKLDVRLPRSIHQWYEDDSGELDRLVQFLPTAGLDGSPSGLVEIPARDLVYYRLGGEGDNWEGVSLLRPAYKHWYIKDKVERLDAIAQERESTGIPVVYPPQNRADDPVLDEIEEALRNLKAGEEAYVIMPGPHAQDLGDDAGQGWRLEILGLSGGSQGGVRDPSNSLKYHSDKIAAAVVAEFIRLGQANVGARATADVQQEPFYAGVEAITEAVQAPWNDELIPRIVALNFPDAQGTPKLVMDKADSTSLTDLSSYVSGLITSGAMVADHPLEDWLRARGDLPPADPQERARSDQQREEDRKMQIKGQQAKIDNPQPPGAGGEGDPTKSTKSTKSTKGDGKQLARQDRPLRGFEELMSLDQIEQAINDARASFQDAAGPAVRHAAIDIAAQVAAGKQPKVDSQDLEQALAGELGSLYELGRQTVADELQRQGAPAQTFSLADNGQPKRLLARARLASQAILARIAQAVQRLALSGHRSQGDLQFAGEQEALAALKAEANLQAAAALNLGRSDEASSRTDEIAGARYTSILDGNRCPRCARADDDVLRPLDDPVRLRHEPPNPDCEGGDRCRCIEFFQLRSETAPSF